MAALRLHLLLGTALVAAVGCAQQPLRADRAAPATSQTTALTVSAADAAAIRKMNRNISSGLLVFARDQGYQQVVMKGGTYYFCRTAAEMGSIIPNRQCVSRSQLEFVRLQVKQQREQLTRPGALTFHHPDSGSN